MAEVIRMPEVLAGAAEAAIQTWLVKPGDTLAPSQSLAEIETDKAVVEFQLEQGGIVGRLLGDEGDNIAVGEPILVLLAQGEGEAEIAAALAAEGIADSAAPAGAPPAEAEPEVDRADLPDTTSESGEETESPAQLDDAPEGSDTTGAKRLFASPLVRKLAAQQGVEIATVQGSGPNGRVTRRDLEQHISATPEVPTAKMPEAPAASESAPAAAPAAAEPANPAPAAAASSAASGSFEDVPLDRMRKAIARRLTESKSTVPHVYLTADCRVDELLALRTQVNASAPRKVSVNDFVVKAVAGALTDIPEANAIWNVESIRKYSSVDISVAVATDGGLFTPVVRAVETLALSQVSAVIADLAERARGGKLRQHELEGGSFSVSNLGMYGTKEFSAILNPPQAGILAVGAARKTPVIGEDGELTVATVMTVTLSADHRVLDGAVAAQWLSAFQRRIENPFSILV